MSDGVVIDRAMRQWREARPALLPERHLQRARFDLWRWKPPLRELVHSPLLCNGLQFGLVSWVFVLVNLWLGVGPQDQAHNGGLNLFWAW